MMLAWRYALFSAAATAINLGVQHGLLGMWPNLPAAMAAGTLAGLAAKYALDKRWIFADPSRGALAQSRRFALYTLTGAVTTLLFWLTELGFDRAVRAPELGALVGLTAGYVLKYRLDRRFVFTGAAS